MLKLSPIYYSEVFHVNAEKVDSHYRKLLDSFNSFLGQDRARSFWDTVASHDRLRFWMEAAIEKFNSSNSEEVPKDRQALISFENKGSLSSEQEIMQAGIDIVCRRR